MPRQGRILLDMESTHSGKTQTVGLVQPGCIIIFAIRDRISQFRRERLCQ